MQGSRPVADLELKASGPLHCTWRDPGEITFFLCGPQKERERPPLSQQKLEEETASRDPSGDHGTET